MRLALTALPCALAAIILCAAVDAQAAPDPLDFTVLRNGDPVGSHSLRFNQDGESLRVTIDTNVVVKMAMIPVYRFEHHGVEVWTAGKLAALNSKTNDDGVHHDLSVKSNGGGMEVAGDGKARHDQTEELPASLWNQRTVQQKTLLNTLDGNAMTIHVTDLGEDGVMAAGRRVHAHHFAMSGDLARDLWYDDEGTLVQVKFKAKDGSDILYQLK